ncbi:N-formylglutamate deformylase [Variovorax sp. PBL-E5]|uniref:N-formylglutamate deformylase n=1 Tax=Variovorax sp. PBL-E5 TaxID=434014 RepID=UPI0013176757|nr:N-formylglutamate deformylase [Variovorax sp. PBL-E5]VTU16619.1 N-formylglutamate deformylase [Variovorax sp. PBL-E5]
MTFDTTEPAFRFRQGTRPLLISMPHVGTHLPRALAARLTAEARRVPDTDWHLERLYDFADALGASVLVATHSRYVIDLNRPPDDQNLYPGQDTTGLCPVDTFDKTPLYAAGDVPDEAEIAARRDAIWRPYHRQLRAELDRMKAVHGTIALWDAHSIRSALPRFFEGRLPDLNLGTANGASCDPALAAALLGIASSAEGHTSVLNGRFKGGHITREYGDPSAGVHAVQLEMTQASYMQERLPFDYLPATAARVQPVVRRMLEAVLAFVERG